MSGSLNCVPAGSQVPGPIAPSLGKDARNADVHADEWTNRPEVRERIEELKAESSAKCSLSREAYIKSLVEMYEGKPSEASMDNPRCDVVVVRGQMQAVFPPKLQVGQQLAKLVNWEGSIKVELEPGENLTSFLGRLFVGGGTLDSRNGSDGENGNVTGKQAVPQTASGIDEDEALEDYSARFQTRI